MPPRYWSHVQKIVKEKCRVNDEFIQPRTIEEIIQKVEEASASLTPDVIRKSCRNIFKRAQLCLDAKKKNGHSDAGGHFQQNM